MQRLLLIVVVVAALAVVSAAAAAGARRHAAALTDPQAVAASRREEVAWLKAIRGPAAANRQTYPCQPEPAFSANLRRASRVYGFEVVRVACRLPHRFAPEVAIKSGKRAALAKALVAIERALDPPVVTAGADGVAPAAAHAFTAILIEAFDGRGIPFAVVGNAASGGQTIAWTR